VSDLHTKKPPEEAAGIGAAIASLEMARPMGLVRGARTLLRLNQEGGFDCPGCAWPEPEHERNTFEFCENGVKHVADEATKLRVDRDFFAEHSMRDLAEREDEWLNAQGRLTEPMVLRAGADHYEPIAWHEAFDLVAEEITRGEPDESIFYTSGRTSNEAAFLYQLFARQLGTNNLPDCSNMCHESSGTALREVVGVGKGTVHLSDFDVADAIFVVGQNPGSNHPRMLTALEAAARRGCKIVAINPLIEPGLVRFSHPQRYESLLARGTPIASLYLQVRVGGDAALFQGLAKILIDEGAIDRAFIDEFTSGYDAYARALADVSWESIERDSGIARDDIRAAAEIAMRSERTIACWAMGLTQHKDAVATIQEVASFMLLRGNVGRPGAGLCPVRGHSNVQGDRTMGVWEQMPDAFLDRLGRACDFDPPRAHGYDTVGAIEAMLAGRANVFFAMGGNFVSASPDTTRTSEAIRKCRLTVQVSTKLNRSHVVTGTCALILPCLGRTERDVQSSGPQFVTVEDSMGHVHASRGKNDPASASLKSEPAIVAGLAKASLHSRTKLDHQRDSAGAVDWDALVADYDRIRDLIARVVDGCADFNARVREPAGFHLRNAARERDFSSVRGGRARFTVHPLPRLREGLGDRELLLTTIRSHDQFNTTIYTQNDRYRGVFGDRRVVFMNARDIARLGFAAGERVDLVSRAGTCAGFAIVAFSIPEGDCAAYYPETNPLVPLASIADKSRTPTSKSIPITLVRSNSPRREAPP
jgi:molybdopterin-dependent oxidoreductase alpha subunit